MENAGLIIGIAGFIALLVVAIFEMRQTRDLVGTVVDLVKRIEGTPAQRDMLSDGYSRLSGRARKVVDFLLDVGDDAARLSEDPRDDEIVRDVKKLLRGGQVVDPSVIDMDQQGYGSRQGGNAG